MQIKLLWVPSPFLLSTTTRNSGGCLRTLPLLFLKPDMLGTEASIVVALVACLVALLSTLLVVHVKYTDCCRTSAHPVKYSDVRVNNIVELYLYARTITRMF